MAQPLPKQSNRKSGILQPTTGTRTSITIRRMMQIVTTAPANYLKGLSGFAANDGSPFPSIDRFEDRIWLPNALR
eukprot:scaffold208039_cov17-Prasinocladus_malaysianus.AAC.1